MNSVEKLYEIEKKIQPMRGKLVDFSKSQFLHPSFIRTSLSECDLVSLWGKPKCNEDRDGNLWYPDNAEYIETQDYRVVVTKWSCDENYCVGPSFEYGVGEVGIYQDRPFKGRLRVYSINKKRGRLTEWKSPEINIKEHKYSEVLMHSHEVSTNVLEKNTIKVAWKGCEDKGLEYIFDLGK